ncbi:MAG: prolipoprotein diacylglyceryl transferase [Candidatus Poribacteria bacterium]|nr:prolipoprotein diacylglyceryl transferase [Candidatus Poribacteria bacterium]
MYPTLIDLEPILSIHIGIHSYGVMLATAFITCSVMIQRELNRRSFQGEVATAIVAAGAIGGILGAKIYYVLFIVEHFSISDLFSPAGLVWYGGLIGGSAAVSWVIHRSPNPFLPTVDVIGPLLLLGYGIGRIGCLLAGDGDYGPPSDVPWAMAFPKGTVPTDVPVHPTPIYETLISFTFFGILWSQRKKFTATPGLLFGASLVMLAVERFIVEFWRLTPRVFPETSSLSWLTSPQLVSIILFCFGIYFMVWMSKRPRVEVGIESETPEPETVAPRPQKRRRRR